MRSHLTICIFSLTLVAGCTDTGTDDLSQRNDVDEEECECKIEGADIGRVGAAVKPPGHTTIRFQSWTPKADSPGEYVGFTLWGDYAGATYVVKAGGETYTVTGGSWSHPGGAGGADVPGISNVDFCPDDDGGGDDEPPPDGEPPPIL